MKKLFWAAILVLMMALSPAMALAMNHAVKIAEKQEVGKYLTDAAGKTLYWFKKDAPDKSACAGPCVEKWPLYYREAVAPPAGLNTADFGAITRADGQKQSTFRGFPLYYWMGDAKPGDTAGQGLNDVWFVIDPGNFPPK